MKSLKHTESYTSLMCVHPSISFAPVGGNRQFVVQISNIDAILIGYLVVGQVRTIRSSVMYKSKFRIGT